MTGLPTLVAQGTRDSFGTANEVQTAVEAYSEIVVAEIEDADHGFKVAAAAESTTDQALAQIIDAVVRESHRLLGR